MQQINDFSKPIQVSEEGIYCRGEDPDGLQKHGFLERVLISPRALQKRIAFMGAEISGHYMNSRRLILLIVLCGAQQFSSKLTESLCAGLAGKIEYHYLKAASYEGTQSKGSVDIEYSTCKDFEGADVLIIDDIVETGNTQRAVKKFALQHNAASVKLCAMLKKRISNQATPVSADFYGFSIPDEFVIGFGLDYDALYRELPYLAVLQKQ